MKLHSTEVSLTKTGRNQMGESITYDVTAPLVNSELQLFRHLPSRRERREALRRTKKLLRVKNN